MAFVLPALFFVIFAVIFAGASGGDLTIKVAVADEQNTDVTARFVDGLAELERIGLLGDRQRTASEVRALVRDGDADVGLIIRADARPLADLGGEGAPPLEIVGDPTREIPVSVVQGAVQEVYFSKLSDVVMKAVSDAAQAGLPPAARQAQEQAAANADTEAAELQFETLFERVDAVGETGVATAVSYYAGAVAAMFLLFSALNAAMSYLIEKENGLLDRLAAGPAGVGAVIDGKFAFLVVQGMVQVTIIFLVAWAGFGVNLPGHVAPWAVTTLVAAFCSTALVLCFVTICRTPAQAQTLGTILAVVVSAIGGSMVPRFLMPDWIQELGWATPNAWVLDAYGAIFWRGESWDVLVLPWSVLMGTGALAILVARVVANYRD